MLFPSLQVGSLNPGAREAPVSLGARHARVILLPAEGHLTILDLEAGKRGRAIRVVDATSALTT